MNVTVMEVEDSVQLEDIKEVVKGGRGNRTWLVTVFGFLYRLILLILQGAIAIIFYGGILG